MADPPEHDAWAAATAAAPPQAVSPDQSGTKGSDTLPVPWRPGELERRHQTGPLTDAVLVVLAIIDSATDAAVVLTQAQPLRNAADAALGGVWTAYRIGASTVTTVAKPAVPVMRWVYEAPVLPRILRFQSWTSAAEITWRAQRETSQEVLDTTLNEVVPGVVNTVMKRLDLTQVVLDDVDLRAVATAVLDELDLTEVARTRIDVASIAEEVIDEIDLPEIIRESTGSVASETVRSVRMQSVDADERVQRIVDRILAWRSGRKTGTTALTDGKPDE